MLKTLIALFILASVAALIAAIRSVRRANRKTTLPSEPLKKRWDPTKEEL